MKIIFIAVSLLSFSAFSQAQEITQAKLQKGASVEYCINGSPNSNLVRGTGEQRPVTVRISYSDSKVDMIIEPPYAVGGSTVVPSQVGANSYCYILTKL